MLSYSIACAQLRDTNNDWGQKEAPRIVKLSARSGAMADATVADPSYISVININPAGLSFVDDLRSAQINLSQNWNNNLLLESLTLPGFRLQNHSFALQFASQHDRGLEYLNLLGTNPQPSPKITLLQADLIYSVSLTNSLSLGVLNNISYAYNRTDKSVSYYPQVGMMYAPSKWVSYGIAFRGLGRTAAYSILNSSVTELGTQDLRETLILGASIQFPVESEKSYLSLSFANEKRFRIDGLWYKMGIELKAIPYLTLRSGLLYQSETKVTAPRFGLGITTDVIKLDYTISHSKDLFERYHQLAVTIHY
jgi:hypothetical protein